MASAGEGSSVAKLLAYVQACARNDTTGYKADPPERASMFAIRDVLFAGPKKPAGKKRKRSEEIVSNRPCSPSLFPLSSQGSNGTASEPNVKRLDLSEHLETALEHAVTPLFDRPQDLRSLNQDSRLVPANRYASLGYLLLPIRRPTVLEKWTGKDIAIFEAAICLHGKKFDVIQSLLPHKTTKDIVDFYYVWKNTSHQPVWKRTFKPVEY